MVVAVLAPVARRGAPATATALDAAAPPSVVDGFRRSTDPDRAGLDGDDFAGTVA